MPAELPGVRRVRVKGGCGAAYGMASAVRPDRHGRVTKHGVGVLIEGQPCNVQATRTR